MKKISLKNLFVFWKWEYNSLHLDEKIKEKILEQTVYKVGIFDRFLKYSFVLSSFIIFVFWFFFFYFLFLNSKQSSYSEKHLTDIKSLSEIQNLNTEKKMLRSLPNKSLSEEKLEVEKSFTVSSLPENISWEEEISQEWISLGWEKVVSNEKISVDNNSLKTNKAVKKKIEKDKNLLVYGTFLFWILILIWFAIVWLYLIKKVRKK